MTLPRPDWEQPEADAKGAAGGNDTNAHRQRGGRVATAPAGGGGSSEACRYGGDDGDVDEEDVNAIVKRADYLLDNGCQVRPGVFVLGGVWVGSR